MPYEGMIAETVLFNGHDGDQIDAYLARPLGAGPVGGVVLIHYMVGWDAAIKEMTRKLAYNGFATISPNMHFREGKATSQENSASIREAGGMPDDRSMGDVRAAMQYLRSSPYVNGKVGLMGFCIGGRLTYLGACTLDNVDAAVDCWGGGVTKGNGELTPAMPRWAIDSTDGLDCPLLGLFGEDDDRPSPADVAETEAELKRLNKNYEFHTYPGTGHNFFIVDRPSYRQEAATDGWEKVVGFFGKHLS